MLIHILFRSIIAVPFIIFILGLRAAVRRFPRKYIYVFWLLLLVELVFPFTIESRWGLLPAWMAKEAEPGDNATVRTDRYLSPENAAVLPDGMADAGIVFYGEEKNPSAGTGEKVLVSLNGTEAAFVQSGEVNAYDSPKLTETEERQSGVKTGIWYGGLRLLWGVGAAALLLLYLIKLYRVKRQVRFAVICQEPEALRVNGKSLQVKNLWETPNLHSAFILPGLPARIYLPAGLSKEEREDILAHEYQHIRQLHPWIKLFSAGVLILHWFNPLVWIAVKCMTQDMEMICDEAVLRERDLEGRKHYAETLLKCAARRNGLDLCLAFGESNTHKRIRHLVQLKKAKKILPIGLAAAAVLCVPALFTVRAEGSSARADLENVSADLEDIPADLENVPADLEDIPADPENMQADPESIPTEAGSTGQDGGEADRGQAEGEASVPENEAGSSDYPLKDYREPQLHYYLPKHYVGDPVMDTGDKTVEYYEVLARKALRELYQLTGTQLEECCFYYTNLESVHFGMTQDDLDRGRIFYDRYFSIEGEENMIESMWIASARQVWYSPVDQYHLPAGYESMSDEERAEWFLMQSGNYNGQAVVSAYQPYSYSEETWRLVMEDGTAYEMRLNNEADSVTDITGPYPNANIEH